MYNNNINIIQYTYIKYINKNICILSLLLLFRKHDKSPCPCIARRTRWSEKHTSTSTWYRNIKQGLILQRRSVYITVHIVLARLYMYFTGISFHTKIDT